MADDSVSKVNKTSLQTKSDSYFVKKAEKINAYDGRKISVLKGKNKMVAALLGGGVIAIYSYTMFSVRQGKLLEEFDKVPE